jgi:hypothetical protein
MGPASKTNGFEDTDDDDLPEEDREFDDMNRGVAAAQSVALFISKAGRHPDLLQKSRERNRAQRQKAREQSNQKSTLQVQSETAHPDNVSVDGLSTGSELTKMPLHTVRPTLEGSSNFQQSS